MIFHSYASLPEGSCLLHMILRCGKPHVQTHPSPVKPTGDQSGHPWIRWLNRSSNGADFFDLSWLVMLKTGSIILVIIYNINMYNIYIYIILCFFVPINTYIYIYIRFKWQSQVLHWNVGSRSSPTIHSYVAESTRLPVLYILSWQDPYMFQDAV